MASHRKPFHNWLRAYSDHMHIQELVFHMSMSLQKKLKVIGRNKSLQSANNSVRGLLFLAVPSLYIAGVTSAKVFWSRSPSRFSWRKEADFPRICCFLPPKRVFWEFAALLRNSRKISEIFWENGENFVNSGRKMTKNRGKRAKKVSILVSFVDSFVQSKSLWVPHLGTWSRFCDPCIVYYLPTLNFNCSSGFITFFASKRWFSAASSTSFPKFSQSAIISTSFMFSS